jgi:hypothetical protein
MENLYNNRHYVVFDFSEAGNIDYNQVLDDSINTLEKSNDGVKTFVSYEDNMPPSVILLITKSPEYSHAEILDILSGDNWIDLNPPQ